MYFQITLINVNKDIGVINKFNSHCKNIKILSKKILYYILVLI